MHLLFVPRQKEDLHGNFMGMYYDNTLKRQTLCDIELAIEKGEQVIINKAPEELIQSLRRALLPQEPEPPLIPTGIIA